MGTRRVDAPENGLQVAVRKAACKSRFSLFADSPIMPMSSRIAKRNARDLGKALSMVMQISVRSAQFVKVIPPPAMRDPFCASSSCASSVSTRILESDDEHGQRCGAANGRRSFVSGRGSGVREVDGGLDRQQRLVMTCTVAQFSARHVSCQQYAPPSPS